MIPCITACWITFIRYTVGFSFGGILAQLCGLYLWSLSQGICPELLERNLLCITFGQPIISLPKIANYAEKDVNKNRFHAIYISDDKVPSLLSCLDPSYTQLTASDMPDKLRNQVGQEEVHSYIAQVLNSVIYALALMFGPSSHVLLLNISIVIYSLVNQQSQIFPPKGLKDFESFGNTC